MNGTVSDNGTTTAVAVPLDLPSQLIGATYTLFSCIGLVINIVVMVAIYRAGLLSRGANTVFILAIVAMSDGVFRLAMFGFYCGPSILLQRNLGDGHSRFGPMAFYSTILMFGSWSMGSVTELVISVNRFLTIKRVVIDSDYSDEGIGGLFTRRNMLIYASLIYPLMTLFFYLSQTLTTCCK